jgi:hypothetical protein
MTLTADRLVEEQKRQAMVAHSCIAAVSVSVGVR